MEVSREVTSVVPPSSDPETAHEALVPHVRIKIVYLSVQFVSRRNRSREVSPRDPCVTAPCCGLHSGHDRFII